MPTTKVKETPLIVLRPRQTIAAALDQIRTERVDFALMAAAEPQADDRPGSRSQTGPAPKS